MPSLFATLGAVAGATVDAVFSEGFHLEPLSPQSPAAGGAPDVNARLAPSSTRTRIAFEGTYVAPGDLMNAHGRMKADSTTHPIAGEKARVDVAVSALPQRPREKDRIRRIDTGEVFEVALVLPGDFGRLRIYLTDALRRPEDPR